MAKTYKQEQERVRELAKQWQAEFTTRSHSWAEVGEDAARFERLARRYGLVREFRENGII